jgi:RNA polymerase sigma factor (sigma-70 family)
MPMLISALDSAGGVTRTGNGALDGHELPDATVSLVLESPPRLTPWREERGPELADRELIDHLLSGDRAAGGRFVRRFERLIHRQLHDLRVPIQDHDDLFQEVFLHLWEHDCHRLRQWQGRGTGLLSSYLRVVIRRLIVDANRRLPPPVIDPPGLDFDGDPMDPEKLFLSKEQRNTILRALEGLSERDRELIRRRHGAQESYKEIAAGMELTLTNVGVALARAEKRARAHLTAFCPEIL